MCTLDKYDALGGGGVCKDTAHDVYRTGGGGGGGGVGMQFWVGCSGSEDISTSQAFISFTVHRDLNIGPDSMIKMLFCLTQMRFVACCTVTGPVIECFSVTEV